MLLVTRETSHRPDLLCPRRRRENTFKQTSSERRALPGDIPQLQQSPPVKPLPRLWFLISEAVASCTLDQPYQKHLADENTQQDRSCSVGLQSHKWQTLADSLAGSNEQLEKFVEEKKKTQGLLNTKAAPLVQMQTADTWEGVWGSITTWLFPAFFQDIYCLLLLAITRCSSPQYPFFSAMFWVLCWHTGKAQYIWPEFLFVL